MRSDSLKSEEVDQKDQDFSLVSLKNLFVATITISSEKRLTLLEPAIANQLEKQ